MIGGNVNAFREPRVPVLVTGPTGVNRTINFLVDTGFNGELTLPPKLIATLGLGWLQAVDVRFADDRVTQENVYLADVEWGGTTQSIRVYEMDSQPLLGTILLQGCRLEIDMIDGGDVVIRPIGAP